MRHQFQLQLQRTLLLLYNHNIIIHNYRQWHAARSYYGEVHTNNNSTSYSNTFCVLIVEDSMTCDCICTSLVYCCVRQIVFVHRCAYS